MIELHETFTGDLDGESPVQALQVQRNDRSASMVSLQRFRGKLGGRQGSFVLQGTEVVVNGKIKATCSSFQPRVQVNFPGCAARVALKAILEKDLTDGWITGSMSELDFSSVSLNKKSACVRIGAAGRDRGRGRGDWVDATAARARCTNGTGGADSGFMSPDYGEAKTGKNSA